MKTRIVYPEMWEDTKFVSTSLETKVLFNYLINNIFIGLTRYTHINDRRIMFDTGLTPNQLETGKKELTELKWCYFYKDWVFHNHRCAYIDYQGQTKVMEAKKKEKNSVPRDVVRYFNEIVTPYQEVDNQLLTPLNHKSETINHKSEIINQKPVNFYEIRKKIGKKIPGILKPVFALFLLAFALFMPSQAHAKTLKITLTLKTRLVSSKSSLPSTVASRPRSQLAKNNELAAVYELPVNDFTPDAYLVYREEAVAKSEAIFGAQHNMNLISLWNHEAHFNPWAGNPTSGACGIPQFWPCQKLLDKCQTLDDVSCQIDAGLEYIQNRYRNPTEAYKHWLDRVPIMIDGKLTDVGHWY